MSELASASAPPAAEVPQVIERSGSETLGAMTSEQRAAWQLTGELPSSDAAPAEPAPKVEAAPRAPKVAPEGAKPAEPGVSKRQAYLNEQVRLRTEAQIERDQLRAEIEALKAGKTAPEAAKPAPKGTPFDANDPKPTPNEVGDKYATYEDFSEALYDWKDRQKERERLHAAQAAVETQQERAFRVQHEQKIAEWHDKLEAHSAANPAYMPKVRALLEATPANSPLGAILANSPVGVALAEYFADNGSEIARLNGLPNHSLVMYEIGRIEAGLGSKTTAPAASAVPAVPPKTVSSAPAPPVTVAAHSETGDPVAAALNARDFRAYREAANERELAKSRGRK